MARYGYSGARDFSYLNKKTLFMHRVFRRDDANLEEYFFGTLEATKSSVTAFIEVNVNGGSYYAFDPWLVDSFKENTAKKEFEIRGKKFVPDYTMDYIVDQRNQKD